MRLIAACAGVRSLPRAEKAETYARMQDRSPRTACYFANYGTRPPAGGSMPRPNITRPRMSVAGVCKPPLSTDRLHGQLGIANADQRQLEVPKRLQQIELTLYFGAIIQFDANAVSYECSSKQIPV